MISTIKPLNISNAFTLIKRIWNTENDITKQSVLSLLRAIIELSRRGEFLSDPQIGTFIREKYQGQSREP
jgi:hypothetical protein